MCPLAWLHLKHSDSTSRDGVFIGQQMSCSRVFLAGLSASVSWVLPCSSSFLSSSSSSSSCSSTCCCLICPISSSLFHLYVIVFFFWHVSPNALASDLTGSWLLAWPAAAELLFFSVSLLLPAHYSPPSVFWLLSFSPSASWRVTAFTFYIQEQSHASTISVLSDHSESDKQLKSRNAQISQFQALRHLVVLLFFTLPSPEPQQPSALIVFLCIFLLCFLPHKVFCFIYFMIHVSKFL